MNYYKRTCLLILCCLLFNNVCFASPLLKELESNDPDKRVFIYTEYIEKVAPFAKYTVRIKSGKQGDYISIVETNCSDFSSIVFLTLKYSANYYPYYSSKDTGKFQQLDRSSILYNAASYACMSNDTYSETSKKSVSKSNDNIAVKILKGIGTTVGCIVLLPIAILVAIFK